MADEATWALVCDAARARIVRGLETEAAGAPPEFIVKARARHLRRVLCERHAPTPEGGGIGRPGAAGPVLEDIREFARESLMGLLGHFRAGEFQRLALFAPPRTLDVLRGEMPAPLHGAVVCERALDLVGLPEEDLRKRLVDMLGTAGAG